MAFQDLPDPVRQMLASEEVRVHHYLWHQVRNRNRWENGFTDEQRASLIAQSWQAPRFEIEAGGGIDFLFMHRRMIAMVDRMLADAGASDYPRVEGWQDIPFDHDDAVWPMPAAWETDDARMRWILEQTKSRATTEFYRNRVRNEFADRDWLRTQSVDQLGTELERSIHGWMHLHWSAPPPADPFSVEASNDYLGSPFSSHVNKHFWKLHGWIDERIIAWEDANGMQADLTGGWEGAPGFLDSMPHTADPELFAALELAAKPPIIMTWDDPLLEWIEPQ